MNRNDKVREVAERLSIVDLIGEYVSLKRSGANFMGLCPFHNEKTPSFTVNPAKEIFHCFGCGAGGDIFSFVMKMEGLSFPEALNKLAARAGVAIEDRPLSDAEKKYRLERQEQRSIMLLAAQHYRDSLTNTPEGAEARLYLQEREVDRETESAYGLGYAPERRDALVRLLKAKEFSLDLAEQLGIIRKGDRGWYELLNNRLIFPIRDNQGQPIGFAGRVLDNSLPKYINSPESPLYHKSSVLFGVDLALRDIRKSGTAIIVEGYFDHLALYRAGIRNALATCGTALTDGHIALLKKHAEKVCLLFDGDNAGRKATVRAMELCLEQSLPVYIVSLPKEEDPDSFLRHYGADEFNKRVAAAKPAFEQFLQWLMVKTPPSSTDNKTRLALEIVPRLSRISETIERDLYEKEVCRLLDIDDLGKFHRQVMKLMDAKKPAHKELLPRRPDKHLNRDRVQEMLLGLMAVFAGAREEVSALGCNELFDDLHRPLAEALIMETNTDSDQPGIWTRIISRLKEPSEQELAARLGMTDQHLAGMEEWRGAFNDCLQKLNKARTKELKQIAVRLGTLPVDSDEYQELLKSADQLRNRKSAL